ncbi:ABC transporter substrate-binding protein [Streptomyces sp. FT05W]|jgi:peptide/nickel transport system substrate-binding protein|uniref:Extracellular solute-binding protein family 5 n=2 Tax=Streptomyces TaxID=1883 RepID=A0A8D3WGK7_STRFA|nr:MULTISPECIES: ABC transporter substrate-binding protein [Streptomyces]MDF9870005.1 peptide/nickel transport system substrate-binding protein [Streptomyces pratensis]RAS31104.1 peptide/nickel transport system substrate-binding protein [Streptomyces avidinii]TPN03555.1 ABC transporter substrate-binding protein [Mesorhizobium sp. B2-3-3]SNX77148.1 peptide/nickel transport system substrate-binding protein [Streptomyces microflavus]AGJ57406.1 oligopeptide ABC transporter periplasmic oligopeptide
MQNRKTAAAIAVAVAVSLGASACSGGDSGGDSNGGGGNVKADAGLTSIVNATDKKGGTVTLEHASGPDSLDPGNTYYGWVQNFSRLYGRSLVTFKPAAGKESLEVVPDLATSLGKASDDAKTWTYTLRKGVKYEDGTEVTSKDVKYAVERSNFAPEALSNGPTYFKAYLEGGDKYKGPYKDKSPEGLKSIETPDDYTIVFKLNKPFADMDYLAAFSQTAPVPQKADTGASYVQKMVSSGPYKFSAYDESKGATLVRNPEWDPKSDPIRKALADKVELKFNVNATTIDDHLLNDAITVGAEGTGLQSKTQPKVLVKASEKAKTDNPYAGALQYLALNVNVKPFDNVECRKAVQYAVDKQSMVDSIGGSVKGDPATTVIPPTVAGYKKFDLYPSEGNKGDVAKAKEHLTKCGQPKGFKTTLTARSDRPDEITAATQLQGSLKAIGVTAEIKQFPADKYFTDFAGVPEWVHKNNAGMMMMAWGADWPTGFGFLDQIVNGSAIKPSGGTNLMELDDKAINELLVKGIGTVDTTARNATWGEVDQKVMENASVVPLFYRKNLLYRPDSAANVTVTDAYLGMYDYVLMTSTK